METCMLFVIDVGNTNTVLGIFDGDTLVSDWRIRSDRNMTEDEFNVLVSSLFKEFNISTKDLQATLISCVVPRMMLVLELFCKKYLGHEPHWVNSETVSPIMPNLYGNPEEVGADRIVNSVAAYQRYKKGLIVIDFGTATTFDVISEQGEYIGGAISPGIMISSEALFARASKLPRVEVFSAPSKAIGKDTAGSMKSGIIFGYAGLVDGMVKRIRNEMDCPLTVLATGGLAPLMSGVSETIEHVESSLTLEGLRIISNHLK